MCKGFTDGQAPSGYPARRARAVPLADPGGGVGDGGRGPGRTGERRAAKPGELVDAEELVSVERAPGVRLARRHQARQRAGGGGLEVAGPPRAGRGRLDGRLHRLPAAARRARGDRRGRRLRDARLRPAHRPARAVMERTNARALSRRLPAPTGPRAAGSGDDRRVVHLAGQGARRGARLPGRRYDVLALVKPQFEVGRGRVGKGGVVREGDDRRAALVAVGRAGARASARACSATTPRACPGRRATARRSSGCAEAGAAPGRVLDSAEPGDAGQEVEP